MEPPRDEANVGLTVASGSSGSTEQSTPVYSRRWPKTSCTAARRPSTCVWETEPSVRRTRSCDADWAGEGSYGGGMSAPYSELSASTAKLGSRHTAAGQAARRRRR